MYFFQRMLGAIQRWRHRDRTRNFTLDVDNLRSLRSLAEQEQRSPEDLGNQILEEAFRVQQTQELCWKCWKTLTPREQEVVALVCLNYTTRQIAAKMHLSPATVKTHVGHALGKFGVADRHQLRVLLSPWNFQDWDSR